MKAYRKYFGALTLLAVTFMLLSLELNLGGTRTIGLIGAAAFILYAVTEDRKVTMIIGTLAGILLGGAFVLKVLQLEGGNIMIMIALSLVIPAYIIAMALQKSGADRT